MEDPQPTKMDTTEEQNEPKSNEQTDKTSSSSNDNANNAETGENDNNEQGKNTQEKSSGEKEVIDLEEKRRREHIGNMEKIEKEFADLKEKFFNDKIQALNKEYESIKTGTHQGYLKKIKELEAHKQHKIWAAERWRDYQIQNIQNIFEAEQKQAEDEYKMDKKALKEKMMNTAVEKKKKLHEEKSTMNLTDAGERVLTRTLRKRGLDKNAKEAAPFKRRLNPPHINYTLKDTEIQEDLSLIQKAQPNYGKFGTKTTFEVYADRGRLYYHNQLFEKGKDLFVEAKHDNGRWHGQLVMVSPSEIQIKSADGTKNRFSLAQLRSGRYTLTQLQ